MYIDTQKTHTKSQLSRIFDTAKNLLERQSYNSKQDNGLRLVIILAGIAYSIMMGLVYFVGVWIVALFARIFAYMAHRWLLLANNEEHTIQSLFQKISFSADTLQNEVDKSVTLLGEAERNEWVENLSKRLQQSFIRITQEANSATTDSLVLRERLQKSQYQTIFNFQKYDRWIKNQILSPITELITLLQNNKNTIEKTIHTIEESYIKKP